MTPHSYSDIPIESFEKHYIPLPLVIAYEPINLCNAKCYCCPYSWLGESKEYTSQKMSREQITQLMEDYGQLTQKYKVKPFSCVVHPWRFSDPLVCPDLDIVFELADKYNIQVRLTTNGVSFNKRQCDIIQKYIHLVPQIFVSVIGFNQQEVREQMGLDMERNITKLEWVRDNYPDISKKLNLPLKSKAQTEMPPKQLMDRYKKAILGKVRVKKNWVKNRSGDGDGIWFGTKKAEINKHLYVAGCTMRNGELMRQMEVLVNGSGLLCCDDVDGKKQTFGNVFEIGIEKVWNNLQKEHSIINDRLYRSEKKDLICSNCSRARFNTDPAWNEQYVKFQIKDHRRKSNEAGLKV